MFNDDEFLYFQELDERGNNVNYIRYGKSGRENIQKEDYFRARYGPYYKKIMAYFDNHPTSTTTHSDGSVFVCFYQESIIYRFDRNGILIRKYSEMGDIDTIYDVAIQKNSIWCAYPTSHTIKRFSIENGKEEMTVSEGRIGDDRGTVFCFPESISIYNYQLFVSDMGNQRICKVDLGTLEVDVHVQLSELVFGYGRAEEMEFAMLDTGLYLL
jgi:hypothetical protein